MGNALLLFGKLLLLLGKFRFALVNGKLTTFGGGLVAANIWRRWLFIPLVTKPCDSGEIVVGGHPRIVPVPDEITVVGVTGVAPGSFGDMPSAGAVRYPVRHDLRERAAPETVDRVVPQG